MSIYKFVCRNSIKISCYHHDHMIILHIVCGLSLKNICKLIDLPLPAYKNVIQTSILLREVTARKTHNKTTTQPTGRPICSRANQ